MGSIDSCGATASRGAATLAIVAVVTASVATAQDREVDGLDELVRGQRFLTTYREGGPVYGTYYFVQVRYCSSGQYILSGQSRKQTVLGNEQVNNWHENGGWQTARVEGRPGLRYSPRGAMPWFFPIGLGPDGAVSLPSGYSVVPEGPAGCRG